MDTRETKIYVALLIALGVFIILLITFVVKIIKHHRANQAFYEKKAVLETDALDKERERIALDLHDDIGASLTAVKMQLESLQLPAGNAASVLSKQVSVLENIIANTKRISYNLLPLVLLREGLDAGLRELIELVQLPEGMEVDYHFDIPEPPAEKVVHIYRLVQEIVTNSIKHSKARKLRIRFTAQSGHVILRISDDGIGFNRYQVQANHHGGVGLRSISLRASKLKASVYLESRVGAGTRYKINIPV